MKKGKRLLAVLLAMLMILTTMSTAMVAFAAENNSRIPDEFSKYLPEDFDKEKAESTFNDLLNQVKKGINALAAEEEAVEDTTDYTNYNEAKKFLLTLTTDNKKTPKPFAELTDKEIETALKWYEGQKSVDKLSRAGDAAQAFRPIALNLWVKNYEVPENEVDTTYTPADVQYPQGANQQAVADFLVEADPVITQLLLGLLGSDAEDLNDAIAGMLYTNANIKAIVSMIYPMVASDVMLSMLVDAYPLAIAKNIKDDETQWAALKDQLTAIGGNAALSALLGYVPLDPNCEAHQRYINSPEYKAWVDAGKPGGARKAPPAGPYYWEVFSESDINFGFEDGDKQGFIDAISMCFRPLFAATAMLKLIPDYSQAEWDYKGHDYSAAYDNIASILQILGAEDVMHSREYFMTTENAVFEKGSGATMEYPVHMLLEQVLNFVEKIAANPATELMNLLPRLAYGLESGSLDAEYQNMKPNVGIIGMLGLPFNFKESSLTTEGAFEMLRAFISPEAVDANGNSAIILEDLPISETTSVDVIVTKDNFVKLIKELAGCGNKIVVEDSVSMRYTKIGVLESNQTDAFVTFFRWAFKLLTGDVLAYTIENGLANGDFSGVQAIALQGAVLALRNLPADPALVALINAVNPPAPPELPAPPEDGEDEGLFPGLPGFGDILDKIMDILGLGGDDGEGDGNGGNGGSNGDDGNFVDDPDIPITAGAASGIAVAVLAAVSAAGIAVCIKKKHEDE